MADRTEYYHEWYLKNKEHKNKKTHAWLKKHKKKLGTKKFQKWKKAENEKYKAKQF